MVLEASGERPARTRERVLDEHRTLQQLVHRIVDAPDLVELLRRLDEMRAFLAPHFAAEEAPGGFFDLVRARSARHLGQAHKLQTEHDVLLGEIDRLVDRTGACLAGPVAEILGHARALGRRLSDHETHETRLLVDTLYIDIGEGG
jgi:hypothetical protein